MNDHLTTDPVGSEISTQCKCCGRAVHEGEGWLLAGEDELAFFMYRWSEGHEAAFSLAVAATTDGYMRPGFVVVSCRQKGGDLSFSVCEPAESHWGESEELGPVLTRAEALAAEGDYPDLWTLVDAIVEREPRLSGRISPLERV